MMVTGSVARCFKCVVGECGGVSDGGWGGGVRWGVGEATGGRGWVPENVFTCGVE